MPLTAELLIRAYAIGVFPMAEGRGSDEVHWFDPDPRTIIDFAGYRLGRSFRRLMRRHPFEIRFNENFSDVMRACAEPRSDEPDADSWISPALEKAYAELNEMGFGFTVEAWRDGRLVGGVYGVRLRRALMGESMFSRENDASKVCLLTLMDRAQARGFTLLDVQFRTDHLARFGAIEITRDEYQARLEAALDADPAIPFDAPPLRLPARSGARRDDG